MWAFAGTLEERYRSAFGYWWRAKWQEDLDFPQEGEVNMSCDPRGKGGGCFGVCVQGKSLNEWAQRNWALLNLGS